MAFLSDARNAVNVDLPKKIYDGTKILFPEMKNAFISAAILLFNIYTNRI